MLFIPCQQQDSQCKHNATLVVVEKLKVLRISVCVCPGALACACARVALLIQHATRMRHIVIAASLAPSHFSTLSHKRRDFRRNVMGHKMCTSIFSKTFI